MATNALIERRGARTALAHQPGDEGRPGDRPADSPLPLRLVGGQAGPLVPRQAGVSSLNERVNARGEVLASPSDEEIRAIMERLKAEKIESLAISFLFSFLHPARGAGGGRS